MLNILNIENSSTYILGWLFIALISILLGVITSARFSPKRKEMELFLVLVFVSPPVMLLLERGNFDILMIVLLFLSAFAYSKNHISSSIALICLSALFKFYTLPIALVLIFFLKTKSSIFFGLVTTLLTTFLVLFDLVRIQHSFPTSISGAFGNQLLGSYIEIFGFEFSRVTRDLIGVLSIVFVMTAIDRVRFFKRFFPIVLNKDNAQSKLFFILEAFFFAAFFCCFFGGISYDYRLIFLQVATFLEITRLHNLGYSVFGQQVLLLIISWFSFNLLYLQPLSDIAILLITAYFCRIFLSHALNVVWNKEIMANRFRTN